MDTSRRRLSLLLLILAPALLAAAKPPPRLERADVDALVEPLIKGEWLAGCVVGIVDAQGPRVFGYGRMSADNSATPDGDTLFEIGSVTKTMTGVLLAEMVNRGEVALDDPVQKHLPDAVRVPQVGDRPITLADLSTHTSGLPRMPDNMKPADPADPYADYTVGQMYAFLSSCKPDRKPGEKYAYSNVGAGLLGHVLARRAGMDYEALLRERVLAPLGMSDSRIALDDAARKRLAHAHDGDLEPNSSWDLGTFVGAGGVRSSANDMLKYVAAAIESARGAKAATKSATGDADDADDKPGARKTHDPRATTATQPSLLAKAMALALTPRAKGDGPVEIGLGWHINPARGSYWHGGRTGGYTTACLVFPAERVGVVVLANTSSNHVDALGLAVARRALGQKVEPVALRKTADVDAGDLDRLVGRYVLPLLIELNVTRDAGRLFCQIPGQPRFRIYPESATKFFYRVVEAEITFKLNDAGKAYVATLHQNGRKFPALRADGKPATLPAPTSPAAKEPALEAAPKAAGSAVD